MRGTNGFGMGRISRQESPQGRDALVQAGVVRRIGNSIGRGDGIERIGADRRSFLGELGRPDAFDLARQIGPGSAGEQRLIGLLLGLAELESHGEPVGPGRVFLDVELEVLDGAGGVAGRHARSAHGEEKRGPKRGLSASSRAWTRSS